MVGSGWKEKDDHIYNGLMKLMEQDQIDAFIPWYPSHLGYMLNHYDPLHQNLPWDEMLGVLVFPRESNPYLAGCLYCWRGLRQNATQPWWLKEEEEYFEYYGDGYKVIDAAIEIMEKRGLADKKIGVEERYMPSRALEYFKKKMPNATFVSADHYILQVRSVKVSKEWDLIRKAYEAAYRAEEAYVQALRCGRPVQEALKIRAKLAVDLGCEMYGGPDGMFLGGGDDQTPMWYDPDVRKKYKENLLSKTFNAVPYHGDVCIHHGETKYQKYWSDYCICKLLIDEPEPDDLITVGPPKLDKPIDDQPINPNTKRQIPYKEFKAEYEMLRKVQREAIQAIKPGMNQFDAYDALVAYLKGNPEQAAVIRTVYIHSVGLEVHEEPFFSFLGFGNPGNFTPKDKPVYFDAGSITTAEFAGTYSMIEDIFGLTGNGWVPLTKFPELI